MVGDNRGTCESAKSGELPAFLAKEANSQPLGAVLATSVCGTVFLLLYALVADSASDLFFSLLSCGVIGSVFPYILMLIGYQRLRKRGFMDGHDGFRAPFGIALSWICNIIQVLTLFLMVYVPGYGLNDNAMTNIAGFVAMVVSGAIAIWWADKHKSRDGEPATGKSR